MRGAGSSGRPHSQPPKCPGPEPAASSFLSDPISAAQETALRGVGRGSLEQCGDADSQGEHRRSGILAGAPRILPPPTDWAFLAPSQPGCHLPRLRKVGAGGVQGRAVTLI